MVRGQAGSRREHGVSGTGIAAARMNVASRFHPINVESHGVIARSVRLFDWHNGINPMDHGCSGGDASDRTRGQDRESRCVCRASGQSRTDGPRCRGLQVRTPHHSETIHRRPVEGRLITVRDQLPPQDTASGIFQAHRFGWEWLDLRQAGLQGIVVGGKFHRRITTTINPTDLSAKATHPIGYPIVGGGTWP